MSSTPRLLVLNALLVCTLACTTRAEHKQTVPPEPHEKPRLSASRAMALSTEGLAKAVEQARSQARGQTDEKADPRKFVEVFQSALRPQLEKESGKDLPPLPIDHGELANPMYLNYAKMIGRVDGTAVFVGDSKEGAMRQEAVFLPLSNDACTAVIIARNAIATARHCAVLGAERIHLGATAGAGPPIDIDPRPPVLLKTTNGEQLDMAILFLKGKLTGIGDSDLPVFASKDMIDKATELFVVGYGGTLSDSSNTGTKRLGRIPMLSADCGDIRVVKNYHCFPGLEIVAGNRAMFDRQKCPSVNQPPFQGACHGDSGGPVYVEGASHKLYLAAIVRSILENNCGCEDATNLYVRFDKQLDAIRKVSGIDFPPGAFAESGSD